MVLYTSWTRVVKINMKYNLTLLNITAILFLFGSGIYTVLNYSILSKDEGWGVIAMIVFGIFGVAALIIDLIIQKFVKSKNLQTVLGAVIIVIAALLLLL